MVITTCTSVRPLSALFVDADTLAKAAQIFPAADPGRQHIICQTVFAEKRRIDQHTVPVTAHVHEIRNSQRVFLHEVKGLAIHFNAYNTFSRLCRAVKGEGNAAYLGEYSHVCGISGYAVLQSFLHLRSGHLNSVHFLKTQEFSGFIHHTVILDCHVYFAQVAIIAPGLTNERVTFLDSLGQDGVAMPVDRGVTALQYCICCLYLRCKRHNSSWESTPKELLAIPVLR